MPPKVLFDATNTRLRTTKACSVQRKLAEAAVEGTTATTARSTRRSTRNKTVDNQTDDATPTVALGETALVSEVRFLLS